VAPAGVEERRKHGPAVDTRSGSCRLLPADPSTERTVTSSVATRAWSSGRLCLADQKTCLPVARYECGHRMRAVSDHERLKTMDINTQSCSSWQGRSLGYAAFALLLVAFSRQKRLSWCCYRPGQRILAL